MKGKGVKGSKFMFANPKGREASAVTVVRPRGIFGPPRVARRRRGRVLRVRLHTEPGLLDAPLEEE